MPRVTLDDMLRRSAHRYVDEEAAAKKNQRSFRGILYLCIVLPAIGVFWYFRLSPLVLALVVVGSCPVIAYALPVTWIVAFRRRLGV